MPNALIVYNPIAGRYPSWLLTERAAEFLRSEGWEIEIERSLSGEHITELARQAAVERKDAFFIVGGDGSLNQAIAGLIGSDTALGVLPAGTANVWAQELGLPGLTWTRWMALEESARLLAHANRYKIDIGKCNERAFLLWAGVGLDAFVIHRLEPRSRWAKYFAVLHYAASAIWNASMWHGMNLRVEVDGRIIDGHFLLALVNNVHLYFGGYAELSPAARLDDGIMDLWLFKGETLNDTVQWAWDLISGNSLQSEQSERIRFQTLRLESDSPMYLQVDGEPVDLQGGLTIRVHRQALTVLVPDQTPHQLFGNNP